jgi:hypothetical protein
MIKSGFESARKVIEMIGNLMVKNSSANESLVYEPAVKYGKTRKRGK